MRPKEHVGSALEGEAGEDAGVDLGARPGAVVPAGAPRVANRVGALDRRGGKRSKNTFHRRKMGLKCEK